MPPRKGEESTRGRGSRSLPGLRISEPQRGALGPVLFALALVTGALLSLAYPPANLAPLAWVALAPLLAVTKGRSARSGAALWFLFGIAFFGILIYWFSIVGWLAWGLAVLLESSFLALFGALWATASRGLRAVGAVGLASAAWVAAEYLRSRFPWGGFTWGELAQSQHNLGWMLRSAGLAGGWGTAFLIVAVNCFVACALLFSGTNKAASIRYLLGAGVLIALPVLVPVSHAEGKQLRVAIVQGNVPRNFDGDAQAKDAQITRSHVRLTEQLASQHPDLVVWPESSVGLDLRSTPGVGQEVGSAARRVGVPMIVGGNLSAGSNHYKVVAFLISRGGDVSSIYQKTHLVPFGEYVPGRRFLSWVPALDQIPEDALAAPHGRLFSVAGGSVAPVLSFEGDFGSLVRGRIAAGARLLIVATNTSTWRSTPASAQHVALSQVRAAENGVWVVHAALSGISAFIAPSGAIVRSTPLWKATSMMQTLRFATGITPYARMGDWLPIVCLIGSGIAAAASFIRRERRGAGARPKDHEA